MTWGIWMAAIFFCAMGGFAGVAALYLTRQPPLTVLFGRQAAEIVLFCLSATALSAVIAMYWGK